MFTALVAYKEAHGDCNVPRRWEGNPQLATWINTLRQQERSGTLGANRRDRLDEIGFVWNPLDAAWEEMFASLVAYKQKYGDCKVPTGWRENPDLGTWVSIQRNAHGRDMISDDRRKRLDEVGFCWDPHTAAWEEMFVALVAHKEKYGACEVAGWRESPELRRLGRWMSKQRTKMKKGMLAEERRRRLDEIGFDWNPGRRD